MYAVDMLDALSPEQRIAIDGDIVEKVSGGWWTRMVKDALTNTANKEAYLLYREEVDSSLAAYLVAAGASEADLFTKSGRLKLKGLFKTPEGYNSYRSNRSVIGTAMELGVTLTDGGGVVRPKTEVQKDIKNIKGGDKTDTTPLQRALTYATKLNNVWPELTEEERQTVAESLPEGGHYV